MSDKIPSWSKEASLYDMSSNAKIDDWKGIWGDACDRFKPREPNPVEAERLNSLGNRYYLNSDLASAEHCYIDATIADPSHADAWGNLGLIWHTIGALDDALKCYLESLRLKPLSHTNITNLGMLQEAYGNIEHAERCYRHALELKPGFPRAQGNLAQLLLKRFEFVEGWDLFEARFKTVPPIAIMREYPFPLWNGLPTRKLAIWPEQGLGDQILYSTMLPDLIGMGQELVVEMDSRLIPAFESSFSTVKFVPKGHENGFRDCTAHIPMMSLGWFLRRDLKSFWGQPKRLLQASITRTADMRRELPHDGRRRIAISWRSFHPDINKRQSDEKSTTLATFAPLLERDDLSLISVQYGPVDAEVQPWVHRLTSPNIDLIQDVEGILATIASCDAVVTTSNVTAHFAGALGKPCYVLVKKRPTFFWFVPDEDGRSLWYPSCRIVVGDTYEDAIAKVNVMLAH